MKTFLAFLMYLNRDETKSGLVDQGPSKFSRLLTQMFQAYRSSRYWHGSSTFVSHLSFIDDIIIFASGQKQSLRRVLDCLEHYERVFDQLLNRKKAVLYYVDGH